MLGAEGAVVDWSSAIRPIWAARLAYVAIREGSDPELPEAWRLAVVACRDHGWQMRALVPLRQDPLHHRWALVIGRTQELPPPNLVFIHGASVAEALVRSAGVMERGITLSTQG